MLVLGGGSDIGRALCVRLARSRCRTVVLAGRPDDDMEPVAEAARTAGATTVETVLWDSTDVASHQRIIDDIYGRLDWMTTNADTWTPSIASAVERALSALMELIGGIDDLIDHGIDL